MDTKSPLASLKLEPKKRPRQVAGSKLQRFISIVSIWLVILLISQELRVYSQSSEQLCNSGRLTSFLCKAGKSVLGNAAKVYQQLVNRPKHWGVPENEPLELNDDFHSNRIAPINQFYDYSNHRRTPNQNQYQTDGNQFKIPWPFRKRKRIVCRSEQGEGVCRPLHSCFHKYGSSINYLIDGQLCPQETAQVCCPRKETQDESVGGGGRGEQFKLYELAKQKLLQSLRPILPLDQLRSIVRSVQTNSFHKEKRIQELEESALSEGLTLKKDSPSDQHQRFIQLRNTKEVSRLAKVGENFLQVASGVAQESKEENCRAHIEPTSDGSTLITTDDQRNGNEKENSNICYRNVSSRALQEIDFSQTELSSSCPNEPICDGQLRKSRYRSYDGICNNLIHTAWGKSNSAYGRILFPDYEDGFNAMRATGVTGRQLPNARLVSLETVVNSEQQVDEKASIMLMQWGQFIDHDLSLAATTPMQTAQGTNIDCCNRRLLSNNKNTGHPACISILLPDADPFYAKHRIGCMNLVRSAAAPPTNCKLRHREQLNQLTHFLDASMIYGNDEQQASDLRRFQAGLLKSSRVNGQEFLPFDGKIGQGCILPTEGIRRGMRCFVAGDQRVNELTNLVTIHTMFLREHNRIARILSSLNGDWPDELVFQETRRIVIAQIQHITYNEFLPIILGPIIMRDFRLKLSQQNKGFYYDYDSKLEPTILNEFAGAAYRLHSLVRGNINLQTEEGKSIQQFKLRNIFNQPASLYRQGNYDACLHGLVNEPAQSLDQYFTPELTNHLFQDFNATFGMDLVSINIQRGRDHGLPGYNFFREACGLAKMRSFSELERVMTPGAGRLFSRLYAHVDDIDLFIAGSYEKKMRDAMVGPVFGCIIGEQFRRLRSGDRFWYENGNQAGAFNQRQLAEIKRGSSMARIVCDNSDNIERVQPLAFLRATSWNPKLTCDQLPWIDLRVWQQNYIDDQANGPDYDGLRSSQNDLDDGLD